MATVGAVRDGRLLVVGRLNTTAARKSWDEAPPALKFKYDEISARYSDDELCAALGRAPLGPHKSLNTFDRLQGLAAVLEESTGPLDKDAIFSLYRLVIVPNILSREQRDAYDVLAKRGLEHVLNYDGS